MLGDARRLAGWFRRRPLWSTALLLAVVVVLAMYPLLPAGGWMVHSDIWTSDLNNHNVPLRGFLGAELRKGSFPLWVPGIYTGLPLVAHGEAAAMNPLTWLFFGLLPYWLATNASLAVHTWLAGFGMVLLAKRLGARGVGPAVAGVSFMLCGFLVEHAKHLNLHHASCWLPWLAYLADRLRERPGWRNATALGAVGALQLTEGHPQMAYVGLLVVLPLFGVRLVTARPRPSRRRPGGWVALALAGVAALCVTVALSGAYLAATAELAARSVRRLGPHIDPFAYATRFDFDPANFVTLVWAHAFGDGSNATYDPARGMFWESWLYAGVVPAAAALAAILIGSRRLAIGGLGRQRWRLFGVVVFWTSLAALSAALMLGKHSPVYRLAFDWLPGMRLFRFPQRFGLVVELAVALLAAFGLHAVTRRLGVSRRRLAMVLGFVALSATTVDVIVVMRRHFPAVPGWVAASPPETVTRLRAGAPSEPWRYAVVFAPEAHVEAFAAAHAWRWLKPYVDHRVLLQPDANLLWGLESVQGHGSLLPYDVGLVLSSQMIIGSVIGPRGFWSRPAACDKTRGRQRQQRYSGKCPAELECSESFAWALGALNVRYLLSAIAAHTCPGFEPAGKVATDRFTAWIYQNDHWQTRASVVPRVVDVPSSESAARELMASWFDPSWLALRTVAGSTAPRADSPPAPILGPAGECSYRRDDPDRAVMSCRVHRDGYIIVADTRYPGQQLFLDGRRVEPFAANVLAMGVPVTAGDHTLIEEYHPAWEWLVPVAWLGWLLLLLVAGKEAAS